VQQNDVVRHLKAAASLVPACAVADQNG